MQRYRKLAALVSLQVVIACACGAESRVGEEQLQLKCEGATTARGESLRMACSITNSGESPVLVLSESPDVDLIEDIDTKPALLATGGMRFENVVTLARNRKAIFARKAFYPEVFPAEQQIMRMTVLPSRGTMTVSVSWDRTQGASALREGRWVGRLKLVYGPIADWQDVPSCKSLPFPGGGLTAENPALRLVASARAFATAPASDCSWDLSEQLQHLYSKPFDVIVRSPM